VSVIPAEQLLRLLKAGLPIPGEDGRRLVTLAATAAIRDAVAAVNEARSRIANGEKVAFWVTGRPGNGKSQSLRQLVYELARLTGLGKYALAAIDFDKQPEARRTAGLIPAIVRQCLIAGVTVGGLEGAGSSSIPSKPQHAANIESLAFGADVLASLSGLPPVSLVAARGMQAVWKWPPVQKWRIRRRLTNRWASHPQLVEFLAAWAGYVMRPTPEGEADLDAYLGRLASTDRLLDLFGYALQESGYTALVLAFDEVSADSLTALKTLWDPRVNPMVTFEQKLNLVFVLAARDSTYEQAVADPALGRRFCDPPSGRSRLSGPSVDPALPADDFTHVTAKVDELLRDAEHQRNVPVTAGDLQNLRGRLSQSADLTWQQLWRDVIGLMVKP